MSVVIFKFYDRDQYPTLVMVTREEFRGYSFNDDEEESAYCLTIDVAPALDKSWYIPLWGDISTKLKRPSESKLVHETGILMAADLDPSSPDVDVTWAWDIKTKKWERSLKR